MAQINGVALGCIAVGGIFVYGGIVGKSPLAAFLAIVQGSPPNTVPSTQSITATDPTVLAPNVAVGNTPKDSSIAAGGGGYSAMLNSAMLAEGFTRAGRAGPLGNFKIESGITPTSYNPAEGAIGFANWEGGRRTALQAFAKARGTTETDAATQTAFFIHELKTSYLDVYAYLKVASDPSAAARFFSINYEGNTPDSIPARQAAAVQIYGGLT